LSLQNQVSGFQKSFSLFKSSLLAVVISKILLASKLAQVSAQPPVGKIGSVVFVKVLANKPFRFAKSWFCSKGYFLQSRVSKIGFKALAKVLASLVRAFSPSLFFLAKSFFRKVSF